VLSGDPCTDALTPEQVKTAIGVEVQGKRKDVAALGPYCSWFNPASLGRVAVSFTINTHDGLSSVYQNTKPQSPNWKELPAIQGFPAVVTDFTTSDCAISVGLADEFTIDVSGDLGESKRGKVDPCDITSQFADLMVTTLKKKAGA